MVVRNSIKEIKNVIGCFVFTLLFSLFIGCSKKQEKQTLPETQEKIEKEIIDISTYKNNIANNVTQNYLENNDILEPEKIDDFIDEALNYSYGNNDLYKITKEIPLYDITKHLEFQDKGIVPIGAKVTIIKSLSKEFLQTENGYFLVNFDNNETVVEGYVNSKDLLNQNPRQNWTRTLSNITKDNRYFVFDEHEKNTLNFNIIFVDTENKKVNYISSDVLKQNFKVYGDVRFLSFSTSNEAWYGLYSDSSSPWVYILINLENGSYKVIQGIETFNSIINFETGDCLYTNEKVTHAADENKYNSIVSIFYTNVFNQKQKVFVISNEKIKDIIKLGPNNELLYLNENNEYVEYKPNSN